MKEPSILKYFHDHQSNVKQELKVKAKAPMTEFLETIRATLEDLESRNNDKDRQLKQHLRHMRDILERYVWCDWFQNDKEYPKIETRGCHFTGGK